MENESILREKRGRGRPKLDRNHKRKNRIVAYLDDDDMEFVEKIANFYGTKKSRALEKIIRKNKNFARISDF